MAFLSLLARASSQPPPPVQASNFPGWVTLGTAGLSALDLPESAKDVILLGENDGGKNAKAIAKVAPELKKKGIRVRVATPPEGFKDFNDIVMGAPDRAAAYEAVRKAIEDAEDFIDPLDDLVERAKLDRGALFESEVLKRLKEMRRDDRSQFERVMSRLKKEAQCPISELKKAISQSGDDDGGQETQASLLVQLAKDRCKFFHDEVGATYATLSAPHDGGTHRETHKLKSKGLRLWLTRSYYLGTGGVPNDTALKSAIALLEAFARFDGPQRDVFVRRAAHAGKLYLDLCDDRWRAIEIDANGWRIVDEPPVLFLRANGMLPLHEPKQGDPKKGIDRLRSLMRARAHEDFVIIVGFLLDALGGRGPHPVLIFTGEPGATKTTHAKMARLLIDPNTSLVRSPPKELRDVYISAVKGAVLAYNNLSSLPEWLSDALCVVTEGSSDSRRELYSDDEESIIFARAPAMLTAVTNIIAKGDLSQRALYAGLAPVPDSERKDEPELWAQFESARAEILGASLTGLSEGLGRLPITRVMLPRMATFAKFVTACETAFWPEGTFLAAYGVNAENAVDDVLEADVGVSTFRDFMTELGAFEGTMTELHAALTERVRKPERDAAEKHRKAIADRDADLQVLTAAKLREAQQGVRDVMSSGWPKSPQVLSGRLKKVGPQLRKIGIAITWPTGRRQGRKISITTPTRGTRENPPSASSSSSDQGKQSPHANENNGLDENEIHLGGRASPPGGRTSRPGGRTQEDVGSKAEDALRSPQDARRTNSEQIEPSDNPMNDDENSSREDAEDAGDAFFPDRSNISWEEKPPEPANENATASENQSDPVKPPKRTMDL
jgi:Toprim domain